MDDDDLNVLVLTTLRQTRELIDGADVVIRTSKHHLERLGRTLRSVALVIEYSKSIISAAKKADSKDEESS
ncbi:MAG TPA: hypothetical protein VMT64_07950 [Candidatus Binataceae bacterium]|nr:hypothetical protein [Candidatus Binataceae bacterium]